MLFTIAVNAYENDIKMLPHALNGITHQIFRDWEVIVTVKCADKTLLPFDVGLQCRHLPARVIYCSPNGLFGNPERHIALQNAKGKFITWLSADNVVYADWLLNHWANFAGNMSGISLVNIHYWRPEFGLASVLPKVLTRGYVDLLNFALPVGLARRVDAFGSWVEQESCSDWFVLERCMKEALVVWRRDQPPCAAHF